LRLTLQNELTPNHANIKVKQSAAATRPTPARPASYLAYSFAEATPPLAAINRKISPVTSSHNWCAIRPKARAVVETALVMARTVRLRLACCLATRATTPSFCAVEIFVTARF
jgi:hypothetical protein